MFDPRTTSPALRFLRGVFAGALSALVGVRAGLVALVLSAPLIAQLNYTVPYTFTNFAGNPPRTGSTDGTGSAARFSGASGVGVDSGGNIYVAGVILRTV